MSTIRPHGPHCYGRLPDGYQTSVRDFDGFVTCGRPDLHVKYRCWLCGQPVFESERNCPRCFRQVAA